MTDLVDQTRALLEEVVAGSDADQTQVSLGGGRLHVAHFSANRIQSNVEERWSRLTVRLAYRSGRDWRVGSAFGSDFQPKALLRLYQWAGEVARARAPATDFIEPPSPAEFESDRPDLSGAYDTRTAVAGPAVIADRVATMALPCLRDGFSTEGYLALSVGTLTADGNPGLAAIANANGLYESFKPTNAEVRARVLGPGGGLGIVSANSPGLVELDLERRVAEAIERANVSPVPLPRQRALGRVLLEPAAVADMLAVLRLHFSFSRVRVDQSPFAGQLGAPIFGPRVHIGVDPAHLLLHGRPFDAEGWPRQPVQLIEGGVLNELLLTRDQSQRQGRPAAGYTTFVDDRAVAETDHLVMAGESGRVDELLPALDSGLLVGRLRHGRLVPPNGFTLMALTGDDVYLVEGGRIRALVGSQLVQLDLRQALADPIAIGEAERAGPSVAPPVVFEGLEIV